MHGECNMPVDINRLRSGEAGVLVLNLTDIMIDDDIAPILKEIGNAKALTLEGVTEEQVKQLLIILRKDDYAYFTTTINLPENLNTRLQIELDNLISNHRLIKNSEKIKSAQSAQLQTKALKIGRVLPKEHTAPKLEIVLYETRANTNNDDPNDDTIDLNLPKTPDSTPEKLTPQKTQTLVRGEIAESILIKILQSPRYKDKKLEWEQIKDRAEAKKFRQHLSHALGITEHKNHPLNELLEDHSELKDRLTDWTNTLSLELEQYDALLDVFGQYGPEGLKQLFQVWGNLHAENATRFKDMFELSLRKMPTYVPFIENDILKNTIEKIARLGNEKYSWWKALIKNHNQNLNGYDNLSTLLLSFNDKTNSIEGMNLTFSQIDAIQYQGYGDLTTTLENMISLLKKSTSGEDRRKQFECIHEISLKDKDKFYFILPEMYEAPNQVNTLDDLKTKKDATIIKQTVYRYLATQKCRLPLADYAKYLDEILYTDPLDPINDEIKCKLAYLLAITTSSMDDAGFDSRAIASDWESFKGRVITLESFERVKANSPPWLRKAIEFAATLKGGNNGARLEGTNPIIEMNPIPSISFLNKILKASEYKFYDPTLDVPALIGVQKDMMRKINIAATLYAENPEGLTQAIRFIKTEIAPMVNGKYTPDPKDIPLLEQFILASQTLADKVYNKNTNNLVNPQHVLLPLLTVFHLEYLPLDELINCIQTYNQQIEESENSAHKDKIQTLLPYALSLFQLAKTRESPSPLNKDTLNSIQKTLIDQITQGNIKNKKDIRVWMITHYDAYFETNQLNDINDVVDIKAQLTEQSITDEDTCAAINEIINAFNELDEEKDQQKDLLTQLISFNKTLTPSETTQFYNYCRHALKTDGLLSRNKHDIPPSYIQQFQSLIQTLTEKKSIAIFEQFMQVTKTRVSHKSSDGRNSLAKCNYLLTTLYPALRAEKIAPKEAFQFASELVCSTPQDILNKPLQGMITTTSEQVKNQQIIAIQTKIEQLHEKIDLMHTFNEITPKEMIELKTSLEAITQGLPMDSDLFQTYQKVINTMTQIQTENKTYQDELNQKTIFGKIYFVLSKINPLQTVEERLWNAGLFELTQPNGPLLNDVKEAIHRQGVSFESVVLDLHHKKVELINKYSSITARTNDFINQALRIAPETPHKNHSNFTTLIDQLISLDDQNLVLSLMYHYNGGQDERHVQDLSELLSSHEFKTLAKQTQKHIIHALVTQLNNHFNCPKESIHTFIQFVSKNQNDPLVLKYLDKYYQHAPFPSLSTFSDWTKPPCEELELEAKYASFDKNPCAINGHNGREKENGFKRDKAEKQLKLIPGVESIFTKTYLDQVVTTEQEARALPTEALLAKLRKFKDKKLDNHIELVMYTIEFLHRCKGRKPLFVGQQQIPGRSYELNTTQIISILAMFEAGKKITAEIGTGEGKSRIMMIENACQFLKGNTPDFITSDLALAERDYLEALPFYSSLGAKVNFITAASKIDEYHMDGINVSDSDNICLFRLKANSQNKSHLVLNPDSTKRALVLDEADVTYFDVSNTQYNYSSEIPQRSIDILPLYPIMMDFFAESGTEVLYREDKEKCNQTLLDRVEVRNPQLFELIKDASLIELDEWQKAAYEARHLVYDVDYTIVTDAKMPTALGDKTIAAAKYKVGSRIREHAEGADHIEQCLHAELNRLMKIPDAVNPRRKQALNTCVELDLSFQITPKRKTTYTTSSNAMLQDYKDGSILAVTGTLGTSLEQLEARDNFGTQFLKIPRHNGVKRVDRPTLIAENNDRHLDALITHILESRAKGQPVLIGCKDDNESQQLFTQLTTRLNDHQPPLLHITAENYRDGNTPMAERLQKEGGMPGQVIITTEILGRGIEYPLQGKALESGLKVLLTYLPAGERGYGQFIGRSGRYGQIGESQMVLNLQTLKQDFGINYRNRNFYANPEAFITRVQLFATYTKVLHRLFNKSFDDLLNQYTEQYNKLSADKDTPSGDWSEFLNQYRHSQNAAQAIILSQLTEKSPNIKLIKETLDQHQKHIKELWKKFDKSPELPDAFQIKIPAMLEHWLETMQTLQSRKQEFVEYTETRNVKAHAVYEQAHAGRMAIFKDIRNIQRWRDNFSAWRHAEGLLFPNFYAWRTNQLSTRNYLSQFPLLNLFIKPKEETREVKIQITSTYAALMQKMPTEELSQELATKEQARHQDKEEQLTSEKILASAPDETAPVAHETPGNDTHNRML